MDVQTAKRAVVMVSSEGGEVSILDADGQVIATEGLVPGRQRCSEWVPFMSAGDTLEFTGGCSVMVPNGGRVKRMPYGPGSHESGANPEFVVTSADRFQRELDHKMRALNAKQDRLESYIKRANAIAKHTGQEVETARQENTQVIDDGDNASDDDVLPAGDVRSSGDDSRTDFSSDAAPSE